MRIRLCLAFALAVTVPAFAQDRPFLFSVATNTGPQPAVRVDYDLGVGERALQSDTSNRPEQRIGVHASRGRFIFLGRLGISEVGSAY